MKAIPLLALLFSAVIGTGPGDLYRPPAALAEPEAILARTFTADAETRRLVEALYREQGKAQAEKLGTDVVLKPEAESPAKMLHKVINAVTDETLKRLTLSFLALMIALFALLRGRAIRTAIPSFAAIAAVSLAICISGNTINLFHLLAMFLLVGMGIDYTVFLHSGRDTMRPVALSLITSAASFGALAFVSFPPVSAFGFVLGAGLPTAFAIALLTRPKCRAIATEHAATPLGMETILLIYRLFGLKSMHAAAEAVATVVYVASSKIRRATGSLKKLRMFARSLCDKLLVMSEAKRLPAVRTDGSADSIEFVREVSERRGVFVLSSHVGTVEMLSALADNPPRFHAWMDIDRTSVFNAFYLSHAGKRKTAIHPISGISMATAFQAGDWLDDGECLVMAGDRGDGAFRFAGALGHNVYFAACLADGNGGYTACIRKLPNDAKSMKGEFLRIRNELAQHHPDQTFDWN